MGKLFGTSGIRGVVGKKITADLFIQLGLALATHLENHGDVVVARDPRTSGEMLESALVSGLLAGGCEVRSAGMVPTPILALGVKLTGASAGVMITASHNPPEYNGVKFWSSRGVAYTPETEAQIENIFFSGKWKRAEWGNVGEIIQVELLDMYMNEIKKYVDFESGLKVVVDCGNGAASNVTPRMLRARGCMVVGLNSNLDGRFPGRGLEPTKKNLQQLSKTVKATGADLGVAHDGDADRIGAVDDRGNYVEMDQLLALMAMFRVKKTRGKVVTTVDASRVVDEVVRKAGGEVLRTRVGDVAVAQEVIRSGAVFGGEPSGSWIFPEVHLAPDGPLAALMLVALIEEEGKSFSELVSAMPRYSTLREKISCPESMKKTAMSKISKMVSQEISGMITTVDGVRVDLDDGWVLIRPSGTEPYIRVTTEGKTQAYVEKLTKSAMAMVKRAIRG